MGGCFRNMVLHCLRAPLHRSKTWQFTWRWIAIGTAGRPPSVKSKSAPLEKSEEALAAIALIGTQLPIDLPFALMISSFPAGKSTSIHQHGESLCGVQRLPQIHRIAFCPYKSTRNSPHLPYFFGATLGFSAHGRSSCTPSKPPPSTLRPVLQAPQPRSRPDEKGEGKRVEVRSDTMGIDEYIGVSRNMVSQKWMVYKGKSH